VRPSRDVGSSDDWKHYHRVVLANEEQLIDLTMLEMRELAADGG
jgi:hypothetical protein